MVRGGTADLLLSIVAAGTMVLMVLAGGVMIGGASTASLAVAPAPIARSVEPGLADAEIEGWDAVVATRRKAAAREIERQWQSHETADGSPEARGLALPPPRLASHRG